MKIKSFFVAALVIASVVSSVAADVPRTGMAVVPVKGSEVFKVIYKSETAGKVKLNIYNAKSRLILTESFNNVDGFILPINFAGLAYGEYTIELVGADGSKIEKVSYAKSAGESEDNAKRFAHISKLSDGRLLLSVVNAADRVNVTIYGPSGLVVHNETKSVEGNFAQVYRLDVPTGFEFRVADANGVIKTIQF